MPFLLPSSFYLLYPRILLRTTVSIALSPPFSSVSALICPCPRYQMQPSGQHKMHTTFLSSFLTDFPRVYSIYKYSPLHLSLFKSPTDSLVITAHLLPISLISHLIFQPIYINKSKRMSVCPSARMHSHNFHAIHLKPSQGDRGFHKPGRGGCGDPLPLCHVQQAKLRLPTLLVSPACWDRYQVTTHRYVLMY